VVEDIDVLLNSGMAIVAPSWQIVELLNSEDLEAQRDAADAEWYREHKDEITSSDTAERPRRDMDAPVSLAPLSPEKALRGLLATPPDRQD
jgi:hypothetical protein